MKKIKILPLACGLLLIHSCFLFAQEAAGKRLTLEATIDLALTNYPGIRVAKARAAAARAGIDVARVAYLPRTDLLWQENRATRNNVFGLLLPQAIIPPISGPVFATTNLNSAWGSAGGLLFNWEPVDFGQRKANLDVARAVSDQANAAAETTQLDVASSAADAFLAAVASERTVATAQAHVDRMQVFSDSIHVLVENELRPGADASRANAELAAARNQLIHAEQNLEISLATLAEALGLAGISVTLDSASLLSLPVPSTLAGPPAESHPVAQAQAAAVDGARARAKALARSYYPRLNYQFAVYGRGSGALLDGRIDPGRGLLPDVPNWATGLSITFPALDIFGILARRRAEAASEAAEQARYEQIIQSLKAENARAQAAIKATLRIAENAPIQVKAAEEAESRARARYEAGLGNVVEVAEAQKLLTQAEIEDQVARVNIWRALLASAKAKGDFTLFLEHARSKGHLGRP